jgi:hypothetical protein
LVDADDHVGVDAGRPELGPGLLVVAAVGDEQRRAPGDDQESGRAGEPGQVADVAQLGDDEDVEVGVGQRRLAAAEATAVVERSQPSAGDRVAGWGGGGVAAQWLGHPASRPSTRATASTARP